MSSIQTTRAAGSPSHYYAGNLEPLIGIKATHDPGNFFNFEMGIPRVSDISPAIGKWWHGIEVELATARRGVPGDTQCGLHAQILMECGRISRAKWSILESSEAELGTTDPHSRATVSGFNPGSQPVQRRILVTSEAERPRR